MKQSHSRDLAPTFVQEIRVIAALFARWEATASYFTHERNLRIVIEREREYGGRREDSLDTSDVKTSTGIREKVILITQAGPHVYIIAKKLSTTGQPKLFRYFLNDNLAYLL